ncbi:MAG: glycosyltransferase, partial [Bacteroidetes bacterium]
MPSAEQSKYLAGFIITYNRVNILPDTVEKILAQSFPPEKLLIVDNSEGTETEEWVKTVPHLPLHYYRVGYNSGPAGGAAIGLQKLAEEGYEWIYWGDDNDP